jgi:Mn-dependent DtxR family transcriptional regulator
MNTLTEDQKVAALCLTDMRISTERARSMLTQLEALGYTIYRKKVFRTGRVAQVSTPMSNELRGAIIALRQQGMAQQQIAAALNVNSGRVAETLRDANL